MSRGPQLRERPRAEPHEPLEPPEVDPFPVRGGEEFEHWLARRKMDIRIQPFSIVRCECGDVNCKGWRLTGRV